MASILQINRGLKLEKQFDYVCLAAHEIKTPLCMASLCLDDISKESWISTILLKKIKNLSNCIDHLSKLTWRFFKVKKYDLNHIKLEREKLEFWSYIHSLIEGIDVLAKKKNIKLSCKKPDKMIYLNIDQNYIKELVYNLIDNALKFTSESWFIEVKCTKERGCVKVEVSDNWIGVSASDKKNIFKKFGNYKYQVWSWLWFWLFFSKKIVMLHGWEIGLRDNEPWGAVFWFTLPIS